MQIALFAECTLPIMDEEWLRRQRVIEGRPKEPTPGLPVGQQVPADFYDEDYFNTGEKSNYSGYVAGEWTTWLADMIVEKLAPKSVLDVGCATGVLLKALHERGVSVEGFDISWWAVSHGVVSKMWQGSAADQRAFRDTQVDLITATELPEHLTEREALDFLHHTIRHGRRLLLLGVFGVDDSDHAVGDHSHIGVRPVEWWTEAADLYGWELDAAATDSFNEDDRSTSMKWSGRFLAFNIQTARP